MVLIMLENIYSERLTSFILVISQQAERKGERSQRRTKRIKGRELFLSFFLSFFYLIEQVEFFWQLLADVDLLYFHRGQPQHRELHALLFSNSVWVL